MALRLSHPIWNQNPETSPVSFKPETEMYKGQQDLLKSDLSNFTHMLDTLYLICTAGGMKPHQFIGLINLGGKFKLTNPQNQKLCYVILKFLDQDALYYTTTRGILLNPEQVHRGK